MEGGNAQRTRHNFNAAFLKALSAHFDRPSAGRIENDPLYAATRCKSSMIFRRLALIS
jgi:hypothetical protein